MTGWRESKRGLAEDPDFTGSSQLYAAIEAGNL